jgi:hypothetical protein
MRRYPDRMPNVKDAIEVLTDPKNLNASDSRSDRVAVNATRAIRALRNLGAGKAEARTLINDAVDELGGRIVSEVRVGGRATGPDRRKAAEVWSVPKSSVRRPRV